MLKEVQEILANPKDVSPFQSLRDRLRSLTRKEKLYLVTLIQKALGQSKVIKSEENRVYLAMFLAALFPLTLQIIKDALAKRNGSLAYEMHFSIFCWLDSVQDIKEARKFESSIPKLVGSYLQNVKKETGMAAWMAGDLLGDHWREKEAGEILLKIARTAEFPAGRKGAIHGLEHLTEESTKFNRARILKTLREIIRTDPDEDVISCAKFTLECLTGY